MAVKVNQSPLHILKKKAESAEIWCSHYQPDQDRILWYKKTNQTFVLMGNLYDTMSLMESDYEDKVKLDGDALKDSSLTIRNLSSEDTAVYFCATRRTQRCRSPCCLTNIPSAEQKGMRRKPQLLSQ